MQENEHRFKILYEELDKLSGEVQVSADSDRLSEYEEIRALRDIVLEVEDIPPSYATST
jgi:hypothetical protein